MMLLLFGVSRPPHAIIDSDPNAPQAPVRRQMSLSHSRRQAIDQICFRHLATSNISQSGATK